MNTLTEFLVKSFQKTNLFEMAHDRSKYQEIVDGIAFQLLENWCLIRYCKIENPNCRCKEHWKTELRGHLMKLIRTKIKMDKRKAIEEVLIKWNEFINKDHVYDCLAYKWKEEKLDINSKYTEEIVNDFVEYGLYEMIDLICMKNCTVNDLDNYIYNL